MIRSLGLALCAWLCSCTWLCCQTGVVRAAMVPNAITGIVGIPYQQGDNATFDGDGNIQRVFNGGGLTVGDPLNPATWTHESSWQNGWQGNGLTNTTLVADLGSIRSQLANMFIWNVTESGATTLNRGTQTINIYYATSPTVTPTLNTPTNFASGGWTLLATNVPVTIGLSNGASPINATVDLSSIPAARYIGLTLNQNYGATAPDRIGLAEIQITTAVAVPEPTGLLAAGVVAGGLLVLRKRRG
ncbi:MAG: hypothetical protein QM811_24620 [Pirellulales bacterium]